MSTHRKLTDTQWACVADLFTAWRMSKDARGRPGHDRRDVLDGILWTLSTGSPWVALPAIYPDYRTCHRWFKEWHASGVLHDVLLELFDHEGRRMYDGITRRMRKQDMTRRHSREQHLQRLHVPRLELHSMTNSGTVKTG